MPIENVTKIMLDKALDVLAMEQSVIANNVANVSTERYSPMHLSFENIMSEVHDLLNAGLVNEEFKSQVRNIDIQEQISVDHLSRVALDDQMVALTQNSIRYQAVISARNQISDLMGIAIKGGRG
jgi:flagellar basal-body rod protein FlgB